MTEEVKYSIQDSLFTWDSAKAKGNLKKHEVSSEEACEVFPVPACTNGIFAFFEAAIRH